MTSNKFNKLFAKKPRNPETELTQFHMDLAASIQSVTEEIVIKLAKSLRKETNKRIYVFLEELHLIVLLTVNYLKKKFLIIFGFNLQVAMQVLP